MNHDTTKAFDVLCYISTDSAPQVEEIAWDHGCLCITHQPPKEDAWPAEIHQLPQHNSSSCSITFDNEEAALRFQQSLQQHLALESTLSIHDVLPWMEYHKPYAQPFTIGLLEIIPSPPPTNPPLSQMTIYLPAGPGFGTGRHETTASCLELLQQIPLGGKDLIDFGCGSGILSLGALCLGARHVWLHDHDNQALSAAQQHLINHAFEEKATLCVSSEMLPTVDVLVANILCDILCSFERLFWNLVHPEGLAIFAGILEEQHDIFLKAFEKWSFVSQKNHGPWRSYILQKPAARFDS